MANTPLSAEHKAYLTKLGISDDAIQARGYWSAKHEKQLEELGFSPAQRNVPALVIPIKDQNGRTALYQIRPDRPRRQKSSAIEFEVPAKSHLAVDIPPLVREKVLSSDNPLLVTHGIYNADSAASQDLACVALLNMWGWKRQEHVWRSLNLTNRTVHMVLPPGAAHDPPIIRNVSGLFFLLKALGACPDFITIPPDGSSERELGQFLSAGNKVDNLLALVRPDAPFRLRAVVGGCYRYESDEEGTWRVTDTDDGPVRKLIASFSARIVAEIVFQAKYGVSREFDLEVTAAGKTEEITVTAEEFERMSWPVTKIGANAAIMPGLGYGAKDEVRAAIQILSTNIRQLTGIERLGWRKHERRYIYVHEGGIIEAGNATDDIASKDCPAAKSSDGNSLASTEPPRTISPRSPEDLGIRVRIADALSRYSLPRPSSGERLRNDIRKSLGLLMAAPWEISTPLYSGVWYAALAEPDFSIHLYGTTNVFKTEYVSLLAQHFGSDLTSRQLPANWLSTPNFIRAMTARAANVVLPVDDFVPTGSQHDIERANRAAEDVLRAQGNASGRGRWNPRTVEELERPRALIVSTGEVPITGHSLSSRVVNLETHRGDIFDRDDPKKVAHINALQAAGKSGAFARVMAAFLEFIAADFESHLTLLRAQAEAFRCLFIQECTLARTADITGKLMAGFDCFLDFALKVGAIDEQWHQSLFEIGHTALYDTLRVQDTLQRDEDPAGRYLSLLRTALRMGRAHLRYLISPQEDRQGGCPTIYGYEERREHVEAPPDSKNDGESPGRDIVIRYVPRGEPIGWKQGDDLYIDPKASLAVLQRLTRDMVQPPIPLGAKALGKRLFDRGLFESSRAGRNVSRFRINNQEMEGFHFSVFAVMGIKPWEADSVDEQRWDTVEFDEETERRAQSYRKMLEARRCHVDETINKQLLALLGISEESAKESNTAQQ